MKETSRKKLHTAYILRLSFALSGVLFILLFTARGIYQIINTLMNCFADIGAVITGNGLAEHWQAIEAPLKQSPGIVFDTVLFILSLFIFLHGAVGIYYAVFTEYRRFRTNALFFLQIFSAIAAAFVIMALMSPSGKVSTHSGVFWVIGILIAGFGSFHIGNGLYNAGITLGISISQRAKEAMKAISWIVAAISFLQIVFLFL